MSDLGLGYEIGIRFVREFYEANKGFADETECASQAARCS